MDFKVLSVLKKFMSEEQYEAFKDKSVEFETELNSDITKYVTANTPNKNDLVADARKVAHEEVIKEFDIEGITTVEQLNKHIETVKLATSDEGKALSKLQTSFDTLEGKYNAEVDIRTKNEAETLLGNQYKAIKKYNPQLDDKQVEFMHWDLSKQVTEDNPFDTVLGAFVEANPIEEVKRYGHNPRFQKPTIVNKANKDDVGAAYARILEARSPKRK